MSKSRKQNADELIQDIEIAVGEVIQYEVWDDLDKPLNDEHLAELRKIQVRLEDILVERETRKNAKPFAIFASK